MPGGAWVTEKVAAKGEEEKRKGGEARAVREDLKNVSSICCNASISNIFGAFTCII